MKIIISQNPAALATALEGLRSITVEAEYGEVCVEGSLLTLAHHGSRSHNPCPCLHQNANACTYLRIDVVGISHLDLDSLGGLMAVTGCKPEADAFWQAAAQVDVLGVHKLHNTIKVSVETESKLNAWWAWSEEHRLMAPKDGSVLDCTEQVVVAMRIIDQILEGDASLLAAGEAWAAKKEELDNSSFIKEEGGVILRSSGEFTNHLYRNVKAVVAFNSKFNSVTVSLADPIPGVSCRDIVQSLWGELAGGHDGIAGSPRGQAMTMEDAEKAFKQMVKAIAG